ncbi:hypothetical protein K466DRAFT_569296 [Polyporus arcularius HHB13444]|uniref:Uncharacterized protein n=1 Tax=Polyporus arcularius HHB13444 TaxID=1314778 RepID=A0A5C3NUR0_9APHY|nr:hypothetical protein K466DRAFT_569296 [Polyporus arcularius HHB13444]
MHGTYPSVNIGSHPNREEIFHRPLSPAMEQPTLERFEGSYGARFYTSRFHLPQDPSLPMGPHYVLYRSLIGPAILSDWTEVAPAVIGVPGSLFEKCASFMEACLRFSQAHMIGGIIYQIPQSAVHATSTNQWLEAFACSTQPSLRISEEDIPILDAVPPCTLSDAPDEVLDADGTGGWWQTFLPGRKPTHDYVVTYHPSPQVVATPLQPGPCFTGRDAPPSPSSTLSWDSVTSSPSPGYGVTQSVVGPPAPPTSACGEPDEEVPMPRSFCSFQGGGCRVPIGRDETGYAAIVCGKAPWIFPDGVAQEWVAQKGSGHVGYYATFREALEGFRDALTSSQPPPLMGRHAKYHTRAERKAARRAQNARYAQSELGKSTRAAALSKAEDGARAQSAVADTTDIPSAMREYATRPFTMSFAFREVNGPALGLQKHPFTFRLPDNRSICSLETRGGQDTLTVKLHTLQFKWAVEAAYDRRTEWLMKTTEEVTEVAEAELVARIRGWRQMEARTLQKGIQADMWEVAMLWGARRTVMLTEDLELRKQGRDAYIEARLTGNTSLQKLVRENRLRIEQLPDEVDSEEDEQ